MLRRIGMCNRNIAGGQAVYDSRNKDEREIAREREQHEARERADLADEQDFAPPMPIRQNSDNRSGQQLAHGLGRDQRAEEKGGSDQALGIERQERQGG